MSSFARPLLFVIRDCLGAPIAVHARYETRTGKRMAWFLPDGTSGLRGLRTEALPLFGSEQLSRWDRTRPVIVTEGEKAALALLTAGVRALGTVTGANGCPSRRVLDSLAGHRVLLWPDNDAGGVRHMLRVVQALRISGEPATSVGWIEWREAPPKGDAADAVIAGANVQSLIDSARKPPAERLIQPPPRPQRVRRSAGGGTDLIRAFNCEVSVSDVLAREFRLAAAPGRTVRCPFHDDRNPSLRVLPDNRRAFCHSTECVLHDRGADAWELAHLAVGAR